jgi:hypothetical protein
MTGSPLGTFVSGIESPSHLIHNPSKQDIVVSSGLVDTSVVQYNVNATLTLKYDNTGQTMTFVPPTQAVVDRLLDSGSPSPPPAYTGPVGAPLDYTGSIVVTASNEDRDKTYAYNNKVGAKNIWCAGWSAATSVGGVHNGYGAGEWTQIELPAAQFVTKYRMWAPGGSAAIADLPIEWTIQGSNDGSTYTEIDSKTYASLTAAGHQDLGTTDHHVDMTDPPQPFSEFAIMSPGSYKYLKLIVGKSDKAAGTCIGQLQYWGMDPSVAPPPPAPTVRLLVSPVANSGSISKYDSTTGKYKERWEDRDLTDATATLYHDGKLFVADRDTVRTYDSETGEFLEIFVSKSGMDPHSMLFHDM